MVYDCSGGGNETGRKGIVDWVYMLSYKEIYSNFLLVWVQTSNQWWRICFNWTNWCWMHSALSWCSWCGLFCICNSVYAQWIYLHEENLWSRIFSSRSIREPTYLYNDIVCSYMLQFAIPYESKHGMIRDVIFTNLHWIHLKLCGLSEESHKPQ